MPDGGEYDHQEQNAADDGDEAAEAHQPHGGDLLQAFQPLGAAGSMTMLALL